MVSFTRTLQKHVTETGIHYVLSIPREIAEDLQLDAGSLCSLEVKTKGKASVVLTPYQDNPVYIDHFNLDCFDFPGEPLMIERPLKNPITKGRSQAVDELQLKPSMAALNLAVKHLEVQLDIMRSTKLGRAALAIAFRRRGF